MIASATQSSGRRSSFDCMRLLAIFGVIALHETFRPAGLVDPGVVLRVLVRWCVPFFFMLTGYFLPAQGGFPVVTAERLRGFTILTVIANLIWAPWALHRFGLGLFTSNLVVIGSWFHLWFLNAMLLGLLLLTAARPLLRTPARATALGLGMIAAYWAVDLLAATGRTDLKAAEVMFRHAQAAPFMWLGFALAQRAERFPSLSVSAGLAAAGISLSLLETAILGRLGIPPIDRLLPLGALVTAAALVTACARIRNTPALDRLARLGSACTLPIYIVHPAFLMTIHVVTRHLPFPAWVSGYLTIVLCFAGSFVAALLLNGLWPAGAAALRGRLSDPDPAQANAPRVARQRDPA